MKNNFQSIGSSRGDERILVIDDERIIVEIWKELLERLGYKVTAMTNSLEALSHFRGGPADFDLVITDHNIPGMSGLEMARIMKDIRPDIPIILCSGTGDNIGPEERKKARVNAFIMKPCDLYALAETVRTVLDA